MYCFFSVCREHVRNAVRKLERLKKKDDTLRQKSLRLKKKEADLLKQLDARGSVVNTGSEVTRLTGSVAYESDPPSTSAAPHNADTVPTAAEKRAQVIRKSDRHKLNRQTQ